MRSILTAVLAVALSVGFFPARASLIQWTVNGTFDDNGTLTGSFTFDSALQHATTWNLTAQGGNTNNFAPVTYTPANSSTGDYQLLNSFQFTIPGAPNRILALAPEWQLNDAGGTVPLVPAYEGGYGSMECFSCSTFRILNGSVTASAQVATPEPGYAGLVGILALFFAGRRFVQRPS
jgi:hypothetical protein